MRIVHYLERIRLADGGVVRATLDLCEAAQLTGHQVTLATCDAADVPAAWKAGGDHSPAVVELPAPTGPLKLLTKGARRAVGELARGADAVHIHEFWLPSSVQMAAAARRAGTPYVVSAHGMLDDWSMAQSSLKKQVFLKLVGNRMFLGAAAVHCTARGEQQQADRWLPAGKSEVIPYVVDLTPYKQPLGPGGASEDLPAWGAGDPIVLFLSRLHEKKGIEHLIGAAAKLRENGRRFRVLVAGTGDAGYERSLRAMVESRGLGGRVEFLGLVVGEAKASLMRAARMLVLPSYQENFGLVLAESLACGAPVVTTRAVDIWPELEASGGAILMDAPDTDATAAAIASLLDDPVRRDSMGAAGRAWVFEHFDAGRVMQRFDALYTRITGGPKARRTAAAAPGAASA